VRIARFRDDGSRMRRARLLGLQGRRDELQHKRDMLRQDLSVAWRDHGRRSAQALAIEEELRMVAVEWETTIKQIRALQSRSVA
jgi:hypothetical protein